MARRKATHKLVAMLKGDQFSDALERITMQAAERRGLSHMIATPLRREIQGGMNWILVDQSVVSVFGTGSITFSPYVVGMKDRDTMPLSWLVHDELLKRGEITCRNWKCARHQKGRQS